MNSRSVPTRVLALIGVGLGLFASATAQDCTCPKFQIVSELEMVKAGEIVEFEIVSDDPVSHDAKFSWTTSAGTIIRGQGTRKVAVVTTAEMLAAPQPSPTPLPPAGPDGFIITGFISRQRPKLTVTANPVGSECACRSLAASVEIGPINRDKNKPGDVTDLKLSTENLTIPCEPGRMPAPGVVISDSMIVDVGVEAHDPENDILTYHYTVSGGRIVGTGANVKWDLSGIAPGTYTITTGVDDGCGLCGKTQTKTVTVVACEPSCSLIECPTIEIAGPMNDVISPGENTFTANVSGGSQQSVTYEWVRNNGIVLSGHGTPSIVVKFTEDSVKLSTSISVRIGGTDPNAGCLTEQILTYENGRLKP